MKDEDQEFQPERDQSEDELDVSQEEVKSPLHEEKVPVVQPTQELPEFVSRWRAWPIWGILGRISQWKYPIETGTVLLMTAIMIYHFQVHCLHTILAEFFLGLCIVTVSSIVLVHLYPATPLPTPPFVQEFINFLKDFFSEESITRIAKDGSIIMMFLVHKTLHMTRSVLFGESFKLSLVLVGVFGVLFAVLRRVNPFAFAWVGFFVFFTVPKFYDMQKDMVDSLWLSFDEHWVHYRDLLMEKVRSLWNKIPKDEKTEKTVEEKKKD
eukprot:TRINITY_DN1075_c0_g1_i1.p1 TRINITY_DN1075_c0_g1~~TRINITY_DN1075_c0_g1_i1.p1  ORF type:complete len:267 (-),score=71.94 TRINITY_DN1075_c0_g1_i1:356-1156(-)